MTLRLLSWNVRGLNNPRKRECDIVCFQETKVSSIDVAFVRSLWGSPFIDWAVLDAMQSSGGVLLIWDKRVFEKLDVIVGQFSVSILLRGVVDDFVWACTVVYGPNDNGQRPLLWEELSQGASFTWFRDSCLPSMSRIDRALIFLDWEEHFENVSQWVLPHVLSDHYPFCWKLVLFNVVEVPLNLKTCG
ncbi:hypothetical protein ACB092_01G182200 [Castanea dentata]